MTALRPLSFLAVAVAIASVACGDDATSTLGTSEPAAKDPSHPGGGASSGSSSGAGSSSGGASGSSSGSSGGSSGSSGSSGGSSGSSSGGPVGDDHPPAPARGAAVPYWEYEAESATTDGVLLGPSRAQGDIAAESSGRRAVRLESTGQHVTFTLEHPTNSIVVRYVIPDSANGGGIDATLGLYVNGARVASLATTSRYSWVYGGESDSANNTPGSGAHHFYDETHALLDPIPAGATVTLQKDAQDTAPYYVIDLVDFETVAPPLDPPAGAIAITDKGATPDDGTDDAAAIQSAIDEAKSQGKAVWIPKGTFEVVSKPLVVSGVAVRGAGMWHSVLHGAQAQFKVSGDGNRFSGFAVFGEVAARHDDKGENAFDGPAGTGSRLDDVWVEHEKCGWWVGKGAYVGVPSQPLTDGLVIHGFRVRDTYADGVNLCNGTSHSVVEESTFRNTGDDAVALWSPNFDGPAAQSNTIKNDTVQVPWRANCYAVYGGSNHVIQDNVCADTVEYPGILVSTTFSAQPFGGTTTIARNTLDRAGGSMYGQEHGALKLFADQGPIPNVAVTDLDVHGATYSGIHFQGPQPFTGVTFSNVTVDAPGGQGILVNSNAQGGFAADGLVVTNPGKSGLQNDAPNQFSIQKSSNDTGW